MSQNVITIETEKLNGYLHHIDLRGLGAKRMFSCYIGEFDDCSILLDCGSSLDVKKLLRYIKKNQILLSSFKYLITTHHHFDHSGGMWKLYEEIKKHNPDVKILTNLKTKELLNNYEAHLNRAKRTYGTLVGNMRPIEENAFKLIKPCKDYGNSIDSIEIVDTFKISGEDVKLAILNTPGHTHDHQSSILIKDGKIDFIHLGEAMGTLYNTTELKTMPVSMPTYFNYKEYMKSVENLKKLSPIRAGFGHFGVVNGKNNVAYIMSEHETFMKEFRAKIINYYNENPETRYVVEKIEPFLSAQTDLPGKGQPIVQNILLGLVYGMMMDLGYRKE